MNKVLSLLTKISVTALSTVTLLAAGETAISAATITGNFEIGGLSAINFLPPGLDDDIIVGSFAGDDLDGNGILSESELTEFSAETIADSFRIIKTLDFDNLFEFELDLNQLDFNFLFVKQATLGTNVPNSPFCEGPDNSPCLLEKLSLSEDLAYILNFEYFDRASLRFLSRIENAAISFGSFDPPTVSVNLTSQPPQTVPEPSVILGILAVLGLGSQLNKTH